jgi:diguanylate cyclase (GGDEF)-like protein
MMTTHDTPPRDLAYRRAYAALEQAVPLLMSAMDCHDEGTLAVLDIAGVTTINRRYGVRGGDALLWAVYESLRTQLSVSSVVCRLAGDEFAALVPNASSDIVQKEIVKALANVRVHVSDVETVRAAARIGVATWRDATSRSGALSRAVENMRNARRRP